MEPSSDVQMKTLGLPKRVAIRKRARKRMVKNRTKLYIIREWAVILDFDTHDKEEMEKEQRDREKEQRDREKEQRDREKDEEKKFMERMMIRRQKRKERTEEIIKRALTISQNLTVRYTIIGHL